MAFTGRPKLQTVYRTGKDGARVVYRDGTTVQHAPFALVMFSRVPLKVDGRLVPMGGAAYEVKSA